MGAVKGSDHLLEGWQVFLHFLPDGSVSDVYTKHSTAGRVAFELSEWDPETRLPLLEIAGLKIGVTICHDSYLGLLQRHLRQKGAQVWINPSYDNVLEEKWASILRLRAVENGFTALCTLHSNPGKRPTHPFGFGPDGHELHAHRPGESEVRRPLSECTEPGIYVVDVAAPRGEARRDPSRLPKSRKHSRQNPEGDVKVIRVALRSGRPVAWTNGRWLRLRHGEPREVQGHRIMLGLLDAHQLFDLSRFFETLRAAHAEDCRPVFWNTWEKLPAVPEQLVSIMLGRSLECCAPLILSDRRRIQEVVTVASNHKNLRRTHCRGSAEAEVDIARAWGLDNAFNMVTKYIKERAARTRALERYSSLMS